MRFDPETPGLIGALMTMNTKSNGSVVIEFANVTIYDRGGSAVNNVDPIAERFDGQFKVDGYCWSAYWNANEKLKVAVDKLSRSIEAALSQAQSARAGAQR